MQLVKALSAPALALALAPAATAAVSLPPVERTLSASAPATYVAPMSGYVTVRTAAAPGTDFDARLLDVASGRVLDRSASFTSNEVLQSWVTAGQRLRVVGTRNAGRARTLRAAFTLFDVTPPVGADATVSLASVAYDSLEDLDRLDALGFDVTHAQDGERADVLVVGEKQLRLLERTGLDFRIKIADMGAHLQRSLQAKAPLAAASALPTGRTTYRVYSDYQTELAKLVSDNPGLVRAVTVPHKTVAGRDVQGIEIARDVNATDDGRPTFFLMGVHHAREWPSGEAAMEFAHMLVQAKNGTGDPRLQRILDEARVLVVPIVNVDGFISSRDFPVTVSETVEAIAPPGGFGAFRRKNCGGALPAGAPCELQYGIDPNRNYGNGWGGKGAGTDPNTQSYRGTGMWSEPETKNIHEVSQTRPVTSLITLHTVAAQVNRPPSRGTDGLAPDEPQLKALGDAMGAATGYVSQYSFQLYDTSGTTEDWNYAAAGTLGYTIELGPPQNQGGTFHMNYQTGVIRQWEGAPTGPTRGKGLREALILAGLAAADETAHAVLDVAAPAGTKLKIRRDFVTKASKVCTYAQGYVNSTAFNGLPEQARAVNCAGEGAVYGQPEQADFLEYTAEVGPTGRLEWHVTQSTRPFVGWRFENGQKVSTGTRESWQLTATLPDGRVVRDEVIVDRGQRRALTLG